MVPIMLLLLVTLFFWYQESTRPDTDDVRFYCYLFLTAYWIGMLIACTIQSNLK